MKPINNGILIGGTILMLAAKPVLGADHMDRDRGMRYDQSSLYREGELSVDLFGTASVGKYTLDHLSGSRIRHNTRLGSGVGLNYFITRNVGIGVDAYSEDTTGVFVDSASVSLIVRFPLRDCGFAPYAFGGVGRQFDLAQAWFGQLGGGMEYRFTPHVGAFVDARFVLPDETKYYGVARLGMRFAF